MIEYTSFWGAFIGITICIVMLFFLYLQYVNSAFVQSVGYTNDEVVGKNLSNLTQLAQNQTNVLEPIRQHLNQDRVRQHNIGILPYSL